MDSMAAEAVEGATLALGMCAPSPPPQALNTAAASMAAINSIAFIEPTLTPSSSMGAHSHCVMFHATRGESFEL
eukprot:m.928833 g.928833  ORF g.928833 m.928833 type:complete len:74 (-) comp162280_c0_seq1:57-278(-)